MDSRNIRQKDKVMPDDAYPLVRENDTCPHWECTAGESLAPMRECWYCKYSDFRKDISEHRTSSVCRRPIKQDDEEEKEI